MRHTHIKMSVLALVGTVALSSPVWAKTSCPSAPTPNVSVRINDPEPTFDTTKDLKRINAMAGSHGLSKMGTMILGLTEASMESRYEVKMIATPRAPGLCVQVNDVQLTVGLSKHVVHLPREYKRGTCQYNVVMRHEMAHVDVNRRALRKYADIMVAELRRKLSKNGVIYVANGAQAKQVHNAQIKTTVNGVIARYNTELKSLHAEIDKPGSKYAAHNQCRSW